MNLIKLYFIRNEKRSVEIARIEIQKKIEKKKRQLKKLPLNI